jgi:hypothetical protein
MRVVAEVGAQDGIGFDDVFWFAAGILSVLTLLAFIFRPAWREFREFLSWHKEFRQTWDGVAPGPGNDGVPGIPERLKKLDGEMSRNGGSTVKDAAFSAARGVERIERRLDADARFRRDLLRITQRNMEATEEAFRMAGLTPPEFIDIPSLNPPPIPEPDEPV